MRQMKFLDLTFDEPAANLACDEALLENIAASVAADGCLRVWESRKHFVVLGHSNRMASDVHVSTCRARRIPILRRISGGGTVVQGPGCLNYAIVLKVDHRVKNIDNTFAYVLDRHRRLLEDLNTDVRIAGFSDLIVDGRKFSGNAQYRKTRAVLVHGTFLLNFDLGRITECLPVPARQPAYRDGRSHLDFVANLGIDSHEFCRRLRRVWRAADVLTEVPFTRIDQLVRERYGSSKWAEKF